MRSQFLSAIVIALAMLGPLLLAPAAPPAPMPREKPPFYTLPPVTVDSVYLAQTVDVDTADWGIASLKADQAWKVTEGAGQVVAVLDTGWASNHRDLKSQVLYAKDFTGSKAGAEDKHGHGTWCAGCVAAEKNGWGMVGHAPKAKLWVGKVLSDSGSGDVRWIAQAIREAADWTGPAGETVSVISMSLGGDAADAYLPPAIAYAKSKGILVVAAAGNSGPRENTVGYPGGYADVVCCAATDASDRVASFSSRGTAVFVAGPGVQTRSCYPGPGDGLFSTMSGTSMTTPAIAAAAANWCAARGGPKDATRIDRFKADLKAACTDLPPAGRDTATGWGKPDVAKLVASALPPPKSIEITFTLDDFTPSGREKLLKLAPGFDSATFRIKP